MPARLPSSLLLLLLLLLGSVDGSAQTAAETPAVPAAPPAANGSSVSKLEQLEGTYLFSLRKFHGPVLLDYQRDLERLKQKLIALSRPDDAKAVDAELEYVKTLSATTGVLPYTSLMPPPPVQPAPADPAGAPPFRNKMPKAALTLNAADARKSSLPMNARAGGLPLGAVEWPVRKLPAGNYEVVMLYSCAAMEKPEKITLNFAGKEFRLNLPADRVTGSENSYRPYRITRIALDQDVADSTLTLQSDIPSSPHLFIRGVFLIRRD